ncbi:AAA family ATPase [Antrihabitans cavernicola]|uniref:(d)CMP kinase n=1 Tax=Antrihabitans cavernicola TaxID=2495913 RepID=A0A5A7SFH2_9NOCA|nr:AAA family ATPase [Spelaeibacter cavernicola]KAA0024189.1 hypothetical protein FOY51_06505 [Spelaeibacter cavernicola]
MTLVVAVDGPSGSGKTTFAAELAAALDGDVVVLHMDDLYAGWDGLVDGVAVLASDVLEPVAAGERASYRPWDWESGVRGSAVVVPAVSVLMVEGVGSSALPAGKFADYVVWLEAGSEVRYQRAIARDGETFAAQWDRWAEQERALFDADDTRARADLIVLTD